MAGLLTTLTFLLPFKRLKVRLLNRLGHDIHPSAYLGVSLVRNVRRFELAEGAIIGNFNVIGGLDLVRMGRGSRIAYFNLFMVGITLEDRKIERGVHRTLSMGADSHIVSFHILDCSGGLILGDDCWFAGIRSSVLTHAFDPDGSIIVEPVELKDRAVVSTCCTVLPGVVLGEGALLAAGSTAWTRQELTGGNLHGGVPARRIAPIDISASPEIAQRFGRR